MKKSILVSITIAITIIIIKKYNYNENIHFLRDCVKNVKVMNLKECNMVRKYDIIETNTYDYIFVFSKFDCNGCQQNMFSTLNFFIQKEPHYNYSVILRENDFSCTEDFLQKRELDRASIYQINEREFTKLGLFYTPSLIIMKNDETILGYYFNPNNKYDRFFRSNYDKILNDIKHQ